MHSNGRPRRRHSQEFKQRVIAACAEPGASVAAVARSFELNDNLVHQWRRGRGSAVGKSPGPVVAMPGFVALSLPVSSSPPPSASSPDNDIRIEVRRGTLSITVMWPGAAAVELASWMRELLR